MENEIKVGSVTDKGVVEKIVYLTFASNGWPIGTYTDKPIPGAKGLVCAKIGNKNIPVGELKIVSNYVAASLSTKQSNESLQQAAKEWREKNAKFVPDNQSEIMLEKSFLAGASFNSKDKSNQ